MVGYDTLSDLELISLIKEDDQVAFTEIYRRYNSALYVHAYNLLRDREEAKDILQQIFVALWTNRKELLLKSQLSGYLYSSVRNRIINLIAHKEVESKYILSLSDFANNGECITDHLTRNNQLLAIIEKEVDLLPAKMREVFELSRKAHLSHKEIASKLAISEKTVKNQMNNALKILRFKLGLFIFLFFLLKY